MTMPSNEELLRERKEDRKFEKWRKGVNAHLPNLSQRIFALRGILYQGCGFHYDLERQLGRVIMEINNYNDPTRPYYHQREKIVNRIGLEVLVDSLFKQLMRIEEEIGV